MESIFGGLFDFDNGGSVTEFIENIDKTSAIKIIEMAILNIQQQGGFTLLESHCLYKCLSKLKENENNEEEDHNSCSPSFGCCIYCCYICTCCPIGSYRSWCNK
mgnify:CR=1 FL=1